METSVDCTRITSFAAFIVLALGACGGTRDDGASVAEPEVVPQPQAVTFVDNWSPHFRIDKMVHVGSGVFETILPVGAHSPYLIVPPATTNHGDTAVWHDQVINGTPHQRLSQYLEAEAAEDGGQLRRFGNAPPVIKAADGTSDKNVRALRNVIQILNDSLPRDWQLSFSTDRALGEQEPAFGEIVVAFAPWDSWPDRIRSGNCEKAVGCASSYRTGHEIIKASIWVDHTAVETQEMRRTIAHEIIHALGRNHPDPYLFPESAMVVPGHENSGFILSQLDRDALFAVYDRLDPGELANDIHLSLGPWEDTSDVLFGQLEIPGGRAAFGAAHRNGLTQSWANGPVPHQWLSDDAQTSGSARWLGRLLGFTPQAESVAGAAAMVVQLDTLTGDLDFTDMERWETGAAPGLIGSGTRWGDGDLHYPIEVAGNSFWRTWESGDGGTVRGTFIGIAHEGMAGTLKRDDLDAAFGASRQLAESDAGPVVSELQ